MSDDAKRIKDITYNRPWEESRLDLQKLRTEIGFVRFWAAWDEWARGVLK